MKTTSNKDRVFFQQRIIEKYGQQLIDSKHKELCLNCGYCVFGACARLLLPITSKGDNCPYFQS